MATVQNDTDNKLQRCPKFHWCDGYSADRPDHEHHREVRYVPATLSTSEIEIGGVTFPTVGVGVNYYEPEDWYPSVWVHISGANRDADAHMRVDEALALHTALGEALALLEAK